MSQSDFGSVQSFKDVQVDALLPKFVKFVLKIMSLARNIESWVMATVAMRKKNSLLNLGERKVFIYETFPSTSLNVT